MKISLESIKQWLKADYGAIWIVAFIILASLPILGLPISNLLYLFTFFVYLAWIEMWNLLAGYSGLVSLGQPAFIGISGYALAMFVWFGGSIYLGILIAGISAMLFALVISVPTFRMRGVYFSISTLIIAEVLMLWFNAWRPVGGAGSPVGGGAGFPIKAAAGISLSQIYWLGLIIGIASIFVVKFILNSKIGLGLQLIRDNEDAASIIGVNSFRLKLYSFLIASFITGIAASIFYIFQGHVEPRSAFSVSWTITLITGTVIGGIGVKEGPILGAGVVTFLHFILAKFGTLDLLIEGIILVTFIMFLPKGVVGEVKEKLL